MKIHKENSEDLGFVLASLSCQAITIDEFKSWVLYVIGNHEYPEEFIDLLEVNYILKIYKILTFTPTLKNRGIIEKSLYGIAYSRFSRLFDASISETDAIKSLYENMDIFERFRNTFPFIEIKPLAN